MSKRVILFPLKQGSRTPEEFREAVRKVVAERDAAAWKKVRRSSDSERPIAETDTVPQPSAKDLPMKSRKRVLLEPATASPKRALIQAAVERVAAERERRVAAEKAAVKANVSRPSEPAPEG